MVRKYEQAEFVVFIIGMRVNKFLALRKWIATAMAMGPMLRTLYQHPEKGFLGAKRRAAAWVETANQPLLHEHSL